MNTVRSTCEIVESTEDIDFDSKIDKKAKKYSVPKSGNRYSIEDDINRLFEAIDVRTSTKGLEALRESALKKPIRVGSSQATGIGISEPVSLKQALRGLCISQAAEMAAMKRLSKPSSSSWSSEAGTIKRLYRAVVAEANGSGHPLNEGKESLVEISLVPEKSSANSSEKMPEVVQSPKAEISEQAVDLSNSRDTTITPKTMVNKVPSLGKVVPLLPEPGKDISKTELPKLNSVESPSSSATAHGEVQELETVVPSPGEEKEQKDKLRPRSSLSKSSPTFRVKKYGSNGPRLIKPVFRSKGFIKKKVKQEQAQELPDQSSASTSIQCDGSANNDPGPSTSYADSHECDYASNKNAKKEHLKASPTSSSSHMSMELNSSVADTSSSKAGCEHCCNKNKAAVTKSDDERSRSREKGEFSQSSKSSIGDYSSSTIISEDSTISGVSSGGGHRPHMSKDLRWEAIRSVQKQHGCIGLRHFNLLKKLGSGDIGTVYLAELRDTSCLFALKVMDIDFLVGRKKMPRAQTEREIMHMLDHPFLPTLFAHFTTDRFSCLVMEYCPGGDLHVLRQMQPNRCFSEQAARCAFLV